MAYQMSPFSLTNRPPAPRGSQYSSMLASDGVGAAGGSDAQGDLGFVTTAMTVSSLLLDVLVATSTVVCWWPRLAAGAGQISQRLRWTKGSLAHSLPRPQVLPA
jgi:hypothetical protein